MIKKESGKMKSKNMIIYHGRGGRPITHRSQTGKKYIRVRKKGGGTKRLYEGSKYKANGIIKALKL